MQAQTVRSIEEIRVNCWPPLFRGKQAVPEVQAAREHSVVRMGGQVPVPNGVHAVHTVTAVEGCLLIAAHRVFCCHGIELALCAELVLSAAVVDACVTLSRCGVLLRARQEATGNKQQAERTPYKSLKCWSEARVQRSPVLLLPNGGKRSMKMSLLLLVLLLVVVVVLVLVLVVAVLWS
jgi:hypothetical protein